MSEFRDKLKQILLKTTISFFVTLDLCSGHFELLPGYNQPKPQSNKAKAKTQKLDTSPHTKQEKRKTPDTDLIIESSNIKNITTMHLLVPVKPAQGQSLLDAIWTMDM